MFVNVKSYKNLYAILRSVFGTFNTFHQSRKLRGFFAFFNLLGHPADACLKISKEKKDLNARKYFMSGAFLSQFVVLTYRYCFFQHLNSLPQRNSECIKSFIKKHGHFNNDVIGTCGNSEFKKLNNCLTEKFEAAVLNRSNKEALCNALKEVTNCQLSNPQCKNEYIGLAHMLASTPGLKSVSEENNLSCLKAFIYHNTKVLSSGSSEGATISSITVIVLLFSLKLQI